MAGQEVRQESLTQNEGKKKGGDRRDKPDAREARPSRGQVKSQATLAHEPFVISGQDKVLRLLPLAAFPQPNVWVVLGGSQGQCGSSRRRLDQEATSVFFSDHCSPKSSYTLTSQQLKNTVLFPLPSRNMFLRRS